jgi:hypothetical protein
MWQARGPILAPVGLALILPQILARFLAGWLAGGQWLQWLLGLGLPIAPEYFLLLLHITFLLQFQFMQRRRPPLEPSTVGPLFGSLSGARRN